MNGASGSCSGSSTPSNSFDAVALFDCKPPEDNPNDRCSSNSPSGEGSNAGLDGDVYENHWHQVGSLIKIREAADVPAMLKLMNDWKVRYFIGRKPSPGELAEPPVLAGFLASVIS